MFARIGQQPITTGVKKIPVHAHVGGSVRQTVNIDCDRRCTARRS